MSFNMFFNIMILNNFFLYELGLSSINEAVDNQ